MLYEVLARDPDLARLGPVPYLSLAAVPRHNAVGTWQLNLDATSPAAALLDADAGVLIRQRDDAGNTRVLMSGNVTDETTTADGRTRTRTIAGVDDNDLLWSDVIFPDPAQPVEAQLAGTGDTRTGILETVLRDLVNLNIGPGALADRQVPHLELDDNHLLGPTVTSSVVEFANLGDQLAALALNGGLGFRVVQDDSTGVARLVFQVYAPVDRSASAVFSFRRKNLSGYEIKTTRPAATDTIVGGGDDSGLRFFVSRTNDTALQQRADWGGRRRVAFVDKRDSVDPDVLAQAGDEYLAANGAGVGISLSPVDTPDLMYGRDYQLGDKVTVVTDAGPVVDVVRQVTITAQGGQPARVIPLVGTADGPQPGVPAIYGTVRGLLRRLNVLERRVTGG